MCSPSVSSAPNSPRRYRDVVRRAGWTFAALVVACGGRSANGSAPIVDAGLHAEPPPVPVAPPASGLTMVTYAIRSVDFGETSGWQTLGFDIDGKDTIATSTDVCQRVGGAASSVQIDGVDGRDDSFGENFIELIHSSGLTNLAMSDAASTALGAATDLVFVPVAPSGGDSTQAAGGFVNSAVLEHTPAWDGTDVWPVDGLSLANDTIATPLLVFPNGYCTGGEWLSGVSTGSGRVTILSPETYWGKWPISHVTITIDHPGADTVNGVLSGVIQLWPFVGLLLDENPMSIVCTNGDFTMVQGLINQLAGGADILHDGTQ